MALVVVGRVGRPHGVKGIVRAQPTGPTLETLPPGTRLVGRRRDEVRDLVLVERGGHEGRLLLAFEGVDSRTRAAELTGMELLAPGELLPDLGDERTFYVRDLVGLTVVAAGQTVGTVSDIHPLPADDAIEIATDSGTVLVPFTSDAVLRLDLVEGVVEIRPDLLEREA